MSDKNKVLICKGSDLIPEVTKKIMANLIDRNLILLDQDIAKKVVDAITDAFDQYLASHAEKKETIQ